MSTTKQEIFHEIKNEFERVVDKMKREFTDTTDFLNEQINSCRGDLGALNEKVELLESENTRLRAEVSVIRKDKLRHPDLADMQSKMDQMQLDMNEKEQALLINDVEISGVPEYQGESCTHIVKALALKLGTTIVDQDIVSASRVGPPREAAAANEDARPRPRSLVVRLARRSLRDELLKAVRVRRGIDSGDIGLPEHSPQSVHVNERLTKTNRKIFWRARKAGSAANWKYVWTKEGRIYAKRTDCNTSKAIPIRLEKDIMGVFGVDPAASATG